MNPLLADGVRGIEKLNVELLACMVRNWFNYTDTPFAQQAQYAGRRKIKEGSPPLLLML